jgi:hypothetical protein
MSDQPFYSPNWKPPPPRQPKPGELLFEFYRERDHTRWRCELRDYGKFGVQAEFYRNERFFRKSHVRATSRSDPNAARDGDHVG